MSAAEQAAKRPAADHDEREAASLLDQVDRRDPAADRRRRRERAKDYFEQFLDQVVKPGQVVSKDVETNIKFWIAEIDKKLSAQLNEIMHHPEFQKLEGTWRGLHYLVQQTETGENAEDPRAQRQQERAVQGPGAGRRVRPERAVQEDLRGRVRHLGGEPYGMLVGDYEFGQHPEDIGLLQDDLQRGGGGARAVRLGGRPEDVRLRPLHRAGQPARPGQDLRQRRVRRRGSRSASRRTRATSP